MRLYTVSDLHVDYSENLEWVRSLAAEDYSADRLILAGDITDNLELLASVLSGFVAAFRSVHFVPGNHELWVDRDTYAARWKNSRRYLHFAGSWVCMWIPIMMRS